MLPCVTSIFTHNQGNCAAIVLHRSLPENYYHGTHGSLLLLRTALNFNLRYSQILQFCSPS